MNNLKGGSDIILVTIGNTDPPPNPTKIMMIKNKYNLSNKRLCRGVTLIEMTVVILVLLTLIGVSVSAITGYNNFRRGTEAAQILRNVYNAQRTYLSENPTVNVDTLDADFADEIIPYLSQTAVDVDGNPEIPTIELGDITYGVDVSVIPPVFTVNGAAGATPFDPSGSTSDGLWDVGQ